MPNLADADAGDAWSPGRSRRLWIPYVVFVLWTVAQPALGEGLMRESRLVAFLQWLAGCIIIYAGLFAVQLRRTAHYRSALQDADRALTVSWSACHAEVPHREENKIVEHVGARATDELRSMNTFRAPSRQEVDRVGG